MNVQAFAHRAPSIKYQPKSKRFYIDVGIGSVCLSGADTGGAYSLLEASLAPGIAVPRHTHTREDGPTMSSPENWRSSSEKRLSFSGRATLSWRRVTFPTSCAIPAMSRTTISWCSRLPGSRTFLRRSRFRPRTTRSLRLSRLQFYFKMSMNSPQTMEFFLADWRTSRQPAIEHRHAKLISSPPR
jgi:hypothetical protein